MCSMQHSFGVAVLKKILCRLLLWYIAAPTVLNFKKTLPFQPLSFPFISGVIYCLLESLIVQIGLTITPLLSEVRLWSFIWLLFLKFSFECYALPSSCRCFVSSLLRHS